MPFMSCGSSLNIMKSVYPNGLEEPVIAILLREILKALVYLHGLGHIHRNVKVLLISIHVMYFVFFRSCFDSRMYPSF